MQTPSAGQQVVSGLATYEGWYVFFIFWVSVVIALFVISSNLIFLYQPVKMSIPALATVDSHNASTKETVVLFSDAQSRLLKATVRQQTLVTPGDTLTIYVDPNDPTHATISSPEAQRASAKFLIVVSIIVVLFIYGLKYVVDRNPNLAAVLGGANIAGSVFNGY